jgi:hypothetical protein
VGELNCHDDMCHQCRDQYDSHDPEDRPEIVQEFRIRVDPVLPDSAACPASAFFPVGGRTSVATGLTALRSGELS